MAVPKKNPLFANVKFSNKDDVLEKNVVNKRNPVESFVDAVEKQIELVSYLMDPKDKEKPKTRAWFEKNGKGVHTVFKYGTMSFPFLDGQKETDTVTVESYADLISLFQNVQAVSEELPFKKRILDAAQKMVAVRKAGVERNKQKAEKEQLLKTTEEDHSTPGSVI